MPSHSRGFDPSRPYPHHWGLGGQVQHLNPTTDAGDKSPSPKANPGVAPKISSGGRVGRKFTGGSSACPLEDPQEEINLPGGNFKGGRMLRSL